MKSQDIAFGYGRINSKLLSTFELALAMTDAQALFFSLGFLRPFTPSSRAAVAAYCRMPQVIQ